MDANAEPVTWTNCQACTDVSCPIMQLHLAHDGRESKRVTYLIEQCQKKERELRAFLDKNIDARYKRPTTGGWD